MCRAYTCFCCGLWVGVVMGAVLWQRVLEFTGSYRPIGYDLAGEEV